MENRTTKSRIDWVGESCRLLAGIEREFTETRPFEDLTIGTGIHLEPKTAILLCTLKSGGARVVATGNLNSTQPETVDYLLAHGIEVIAEQTIDQSVHDFSLNRIIAETPDLLLDNGGDLFELYAEPLSRPPGRNRGNHLRPHAARADARTVEQADPGYQ